MTIDADRPIEDRYRIDAVETALDLLTLVAETPDLGLSEIARRCGQNKTRAYRMLCSLESKGFVTFSPESRSYRLGMLALTVGNAAARQIEIARLAAPFLARLGSETGETPQLRVLRGRESICVAAWEPDREIKVDPQLGERRPLHAGSSIVLLAFMNEADREEVLSAPLERFTQRTCTDPDSLRAILARVREECLYLSYGEVSPDLMSICVPVTAPDGKVLAALNLGAPAGRVTESLLSSYIEAVRKTADELARQLDGLPVTRGYGRKRPAHHRRAE